MLPLPLLWSHEPPCFQADQVGQQLPKPEALFFLALHDTTRKQFKLGDEDVMIRATSKVNAKY